MNNDYKNLPPLNDEAGEAMKRVCDPSGRLRVKIPNTPMVEHLLKIKEAREACLYGSHAWTTKSTPYGDVEVCQECGRTK